MTFIGERYTFTSEFYPTLEGASEEEQIQFAVNHSALHIMKSVGVIAAEVEAADHGGEMDPEKLKTATTKMLVNVLKLAEVLGISGEQLADNVPNVMRSA